MRACVTTILGIEFYTKYLLINKYNIYINYNKKTGTTYSIIVQSRLAIHAISVIVDLLSSKDLVVVVDFHRFTDCHPEAIFDVNKRQDFSWGSLSSSSGRMFVWSPAIPLRTQFGSVRYFFTLLLATVWSNYQTLFNDLFEVYSTKMVTLSPNVQTVLLINSTLYSIDPSHAVNHSY